MLRLGSFIVLVLSPNSTLPKILMVLHGHDYRILIIIIYLSSHTTSAQRAVPFSTPFLSRNIFPSTMLKILLFSVLLSHVDFVPVGIDCGFVFNHFKAPYLTAL